MTARLWILDKVAKALGLLVHHEGLPYGTARNALPTDSYSLASNLQAGRKISDNFAIRAPEQYRAAGPWLPPSS